MMPDAFIDVSLTANSFGRVTSGGMCYLIRGSRISSAEGGDYKQGRAGLAALEECLVVLMVLQPLTVESVQLMRPGSIAATKYLPHTLA